MLLQSNGLGIRSNNSSTSAYWKQWGAAGIGSGNTTQEIFRYTASSGIPANTYFGFYGQFTYGTLVYSNYNPRYETRYFGARIAGYNNSWTRVTEGFPQQDGDAYYLSLTDDYGYTTNVGRFRLTSSTGTSFSYAFTGWVFCSNWDYVTLS